MGCERYPEGAEEGEKAVGGEGEEKGGEGAAEGLLGEGPVGVPETWEGVSWGLGAGIVWEEESVRSWNE